VSEPITFLDLEDVVELARRLPGDPPPIRDIGLLGSAVVRPQTSIGGTDAYRTIWAKAAALLDSIVNNHALVDGNKRLGWLSAAVFLEVNDASVAAASNDDIYALVIRVASGTLPLHEIADAIESLSR
jgi:death-on-curing protein